MGKENNFQDGVVELGTKDGVAFIEQASPLTRLHYFDGKFLRADAFAKEQDYHRARTRLSNLAGGWGAVNGLGIRLSGNQLTVSAGLAITAAGNFVLATGDMQADLADLLEVAAPAPAGGNPEFDTCFEAPKKGIKETTGLHIYEITAGPVEGLCGSEAVYGKLCESACASDSQHPYWREGVVLRLRPIGLQLPGSSAVALSSTHLRNRVASAYFAAEPWLTPSALSATGLASDLWCNPASLYGRDEVVIGLLVREANTNRVLDAWSGRRERMDTQARGYWQGRMAMRPWNVFTAQILQFQCQLAGLFDKTDMVIKPSDECGQLRQLLDRTRKELEALHKKYSEGAQKILKQFGDKPTKKEMEFVANEVKTSYAELYEISSALSAADIGKGALPKQRMLLNSGFVELPPAGYLPVSPGKVGIEEQCSRMFGEGVRLHYHAVRGDEIAHLVEEAQHLDRISLTRGLDDPKRLENVEIFVPDGKVIDARAQANGTWWQVDMHYEAIRALSLAVRDLDDADKDATNKDSQEAVKDHVSAQAGTTVLAQTTEAPQGSLSLLKGKRGAKAKAKALTINTNVAALSAHAAPAEAAAAAAAASETSPDASGNQLSGNQLSGNQLSGFNQIKLPALTGLSRTESREDGSYGFTLVTAPDALDTEDGQRDNPAYRLKANPLDSSRQSAARKLVLYFSGDVEKDPFDLPIGGELRITGETRLMSGAATAVSAANGQLTVLSQRSAENGFIERLVQADMLTTSTVFGKTGGPVTLTDRTSLRFNILRKGDGDAGSFVLDDARHNPQSSPVFFEWDDSPRRAVMFVMAAQAQEAVSLSIMRALFRKAEAPSAPAGAPTLSLTERENTGSDSALARQQLLGMNALSGMPAITGADGAAAMNAIVALADASDDPAFLVRARRRLFPALDAPLAHEVRAIHDWVMFRRARTHFCPPVCAPEAAPTVEAFQVWHLKIGGAEQLKRLEAALDKGDPKAIAQLEFRRVGILRYRDESAYSEESADRVRQMWQLAGPGAQAVIGRVWESAPTTGQGWQNHFRLRNMLEQIASLTKPPVRGDGALAAIPAPPYPLADGALDGGMLVVTIDVVANLYTHRLLTANVETFALLNRILKEKPTASWEAVQALLDKNSFSHDFNIRFHDATPAIDDIKKLKEADAVMRQTTGEYKLSAIRIDGSTLLAGENPTAQHATLCQAVQVTEQSGIFSASASDLGAGAHTITILGYAHLETPVVFYDHQVVYTDEKSFDSLHRRIVSAGANDVLGQLNLEIMQNKHRVTVVTFDNGVLNTQSVNNINAFDATMRQVNQDYAIKAFRIDAPTARAGEDLNAEHAAITRVLAVSSGNMLGAFTASSFDTRNGFHAVTLLGYFPVQD